MDKGSKGQENKRTREQKDKGTKGQGNKRKKEQQGKKWTREEVDKG